jgi:hypothetical protein
VLIIRNDALLYSFLGIVKLRIFKRKKSGTLEHALTMLDEPALK